MTGEVPARQYQEIPPATLQRQITDVRQHHTEIIQATAAEAHPPVPHMGHHTAGEARLPPTTTSHPHTTGASLHITASLRSTIRPPEEVHIPGIQGEAYREAAVSREVRRHPEAQEVPEVHPGAEAVQEDKSSRAHINTNSKNIKNEKVSDYIIIAGSCIKCGSANNV